MEPLEKARRQDLPRSPALMTSRIAYRSLFDVPVFDTPVDKLRPASSARGP
jgi:hypothetical protein